MRIIMLASVINVHTVRWANKFTEKGCIVTILSCADHFPSDTAQIGINSGVTLHKLPFRSWRGVGYFLNVLHCKRLLKTTEYQVINAHYASGYGTLARLVNERPVALSVWGSDVFSFPDKSALHRKIVVSNLKFSDLILSTSNIMAARVRELLELSSQYIPVTPFGVELGNFDPKQNFSQIDKPLSICIIKSMKEIYGVEELIQSIAKLVEIFGEVESEKSFHLNIYGDGPARAKFESLTLELRLSPYITFHGAVANEKVPSILKDCDIYVIPSREESFGVAAVEAMAAGLPVVSSDAPGLMEVLENDVTGLIVPVGDSDQLAEALLKLINSPNLRARLGSAARIEAEKSYNFNLNAETFIQALKTIAIT